MWGDILLCFFFFSYNESLWELQFCLLFYFILFIYYLWLCWVFVSVRGLSLVVASGGHSSSWCAGLSLSWPFLLRSTGSRHAGSVIVAHGPSCSTAYGIFPDQGSNPCPLHWQADSQPLHHQGRPLLWFWFAFPWWLVMRRILSCVNWLSVYLCLLWKNVYSGSLPIFKSDCLFFDIELYEFSIYFGY